MKLSIQFVNCKGLESHWSSVAFNFPIPSFVWRVNFEFLNFTVIIISEHENSSIKIKTNNISKYVNQNYFLTKCGSFTKNSTKSNFYSIFQKKI